MKPEILGVGAPVIDRVVHVEDALLKTLGIEKGGMTIVDLPMLETIQRSFHSHSIAGGSAANAIKGLAHLGHSCALVGKIGSDAWGEKFLQSISKLPIQSFYQKSQTPTAQILALVTPDKERTFCSFVGASVEMRPGDLLPSFFAGRKLVHIEGFTLLATGVTERAMKLAKNAGAKISFDLANFELVRAHKEELERLLKNDVDIVFANEKEAAALTGLNPEKACAALSEMCEIAVVFCGEKGSWIGREGELFFQPAQQVSAIDTTGAGDLFASGFLHGYLQGCSLDLCAAYGTLVAGAVVQIIGAELPLGTWDRLRSRYSRMHAG